MKKLLFLLIAILLVLTGCAGGNNGGNTGGNGGGDAPVEEATDYVIRIYSNSNSPERTTWLIAAAKEAGFEISIDDTSVISGDNVAVQAANENKDGDIIFGLNETRWGQLVNNQYENVRIMDWTPSWADKVGAYKYDGKAYGLVIQNVLMLYRTDEYGTNGEEIHLEHWGDIVDYAKSKGWVWYRQNKVGGTTNANINSSILYPYVDPSSPAGGVSVDGWKKLWEYCADGKFFVDDSQGIRPLIRGDVAIGTFYSSSLYGEIDAGDGVSDHPLKGTTSPENWQLCDFADGTYYIAEYLGIVDKEGRSEAETAHVKAFAEWFGSAETQIAWSEEFDSYPCNEDAVKVLYPNGIPPIYQIENFSLKEVPGTGGNYAQYVAAHSAEWTNILTNLGYYWNEDAKAPTTPDWDNLDWSTLTQKQD